MYLAFRRSLHIKLERSLFANYDELVHVCSLRLGILGHQIIEIFPDHTAIHRGAIICVPFAASVCTEEDQTSDDAKMGLL